MARLCGFGDYLANSAVFADMRAEADEQGKGLVAMLDEVAAAAPEEGFPGTGIGRVLDAYCTAAPSSSKLRVWKATR